MNTVIYPDAVQELLQSEKFLNWRKPRPRLAKTISDQTEASERPIRPREPALSVDEKHFSPQELADAWGVSTETIRQIFRDEDGVLKIGKAGTRVNAGTSLCGFQKELPSVFTEGCSPDAEPVQAAHRQVS